MCGIIGIFDLTGSSVNPELLGRMTNILKHRGPDDEGYLLVNTSTGRCEPRAGDGTVPELKQVKAHLAASIDVIADLALGHRRLSIIDISPAGHQPMSNEDGTVWIVYNGEIYNYADLAEELKRRGHGFRSKTDTEVVIHSYEEWGAECLNKFNGMWAFAIWDSKKKKLFCSRDRFGIKPFYYYFDGIRFLFASEIKALLEAEFVKREPNERIARVFIAGGAVDHTEETFFAGIKVLRGGHYLELSPSQAAPTIQRFYDVPLATVSATLTEGEYAKRFYNLFEDSVRLRLVSDVPIGSCLSGGLDSSSIVCVIDKLMREKGVKIPGGDEIQRTFSARYSDKRHDEGPFIDDVVKKIDVRANFTYPTAQELWKDLLHLIWHQEEPFGTTSIYAQWEVFKLFKQCGVKVALDGQGGDELLAGYHGYFAVLFAYLMRTSQWQKLARECFGYARVHGLAACRNLLMLTYYWLRQHARVYIVDRPWLGRRPTDRLKNHPAPIDNNRQHEASFFDWYLYDSLVTTSIPALLRYEDKNSMAHSVESRVPFLDYHLVEFTFTLPWSQKIRDGKTKVVLRRAMSGILPESIANRQDKIGFSTPEDNWFRSDLRNEVSEIINSQSFRERPFFDIRRVRQEWEAHQARRKNISPEIWRWINLELWLRMFIDQDLTHRS